MFCQLCLDRNENSIDFDSDEGKQSNVAEILIKHFSFCFESEPYHRVVCRKCWWKVDIFNKFYEHIRAIHNSVDENEEIFATEITINQKEKTDLSLQHSEHNIPDNINDDSSAESKDSWAWNIDASEVQNVPNQSIAKKPIAHKRASTAVECSKVGDNKETNLIVSLSKGMKSKFTEEMYKHSFGELLRCNQCDLTCFRRDVLYRHIKSVHNKLKFCCSDDGCVESFATQKEFDEHSFEYHSRVKCSHCPKLVRRAYLSLHVNLNHDETKHIVCDQCGQISGNLGRHKDHVFRKHERPEKVQCDICKTWHAYKSGIRNHMSNKHYDKKPLKCPICEKVFPNRISLTAHKRIHKPKSSQCTFCDKKFVTPCNLRKHLQTHVSKGFPCEPCQKVYKIEDSLRRHIKEKHTVTKLNISKKST